MVLQSISLSIKFSLEMTWPVNFINKVKEYKNPKLTHFNRASKYLRKIRCANFQIGYMTTDDYNFYKRSGKCRNTLYETKSYLVVKIHVNHVDVCTLLHFWSTLHSETDMADTFDRVRFSKLFLHHCNEVKSSIIFFNDVPFSSKLYQKWWNFWMK